MYAQNHSTRSAIFLNGLVDKLIQTYLLTQWLRHGSPFFTKKVSIIFSFFKCFVSDNLSYSNKPKICTLKFKTTSMIHIKNNEVKTQIVNEK